MFRRKQNQIVQLINVTPLGAKSDRLHDSNQVNTVQSSSSRGIWHGRRLKSNMTPERRSKSLEGNLDNIDLVTVVDQDKRKSQHSSQPHGLNVNTDPVKDNPQMSALHVSPVVDHRPLITAIPHSSFPPSPPSTMSTAAEGTATTHVGVTRERITDDSVTAFPGGGHDVISTKTLLKHSNTVDMKKVKSGKSDGEDVDPMKFEDFRMPQSIRAQQHLPYQNVLAQKQLTSTMQAGPSSKSPMKTNHPEPGDKQFRDRTDTANSIKFDISYDL